MLTPNQGVSSDSRAAAAKIGVQLHDTRTPEVDGLHEVAYSSETRKVYSLIGTCRFRASNHTESRQAQYEVPPLINN
jgi:hypothetical protein